MTFLNKAALAGLTLAATAAMPELAAAANGFTTNSTVLQAGPGRNYPMIRPVPNGAAITIYGCIRGFRWCDVSYRRDRGWVDGDDVVATYRGRRAPIATIGPSIGLPFVTFNFGSYWDRNYRGRDFYRDRDRFRGGGDGDHDGRRRDNDHGNDRPQSGSIKIGPGGVTVQPPRP